MSVAPADSNLSNGAVATTQTPVVVPPTAPATDDAAAAATTTTSSSSSATAGDVDKDKAEDKAEEKAEEKGEEKDKVEDEEKAEGEDKPKGAKKKKASGKSKKAPKAKKAKVEAKAPVGHQFNISKALDKEHEGKTFAQIIQLPPSALQGFSEKHNEMLAEFKITTIGEMAQWKFFRIARALVTLAATEEKGKRPIGSLMNFDKAVDKEYEHHTLKAICRLPCSALQGLAKWADETLKGKSIANLGKWKYFLWAEAMVTLAQYEDAAFKPKKDED